ncbi:MAG: HNH endonuclease [Phormidesmis sp. CAN_BIN44]|nr:HNH endonuclease [Phormidesmis sp. CAN_BIN44]
MDNLSFDAEKYYLGTLCIHKHHWNESQNSLRRITRKECLECERVRSKAYRDRYPDRSQTSVRQYRERYPEVAIRISRSQRLSGRSAQITKQWRKRHPEYRPIHADHERIRRFKKRASRSIDYTPKQIRVRFSEFNHRCAYCESSKNLTVDHFIAIAVDGSDCLGNIIPACFSCNSSKQASDPLQWYQKQEFYSERRWAFILSVLGRKDYRQMPLF